MAVANAQNKAYERMTKAQLVDALIAHTTEPSDNQVRETLEASPIGISIIDWKTAERLFVNDALVGMFQAKNKDELLCDDLTDTWVDPEDFRYVRKSFQNNNRIVNYEAERRRSNGTPFWELLNAQPFIFEGIKAGIIWHIDITVQKQTEEKLRKAKNAAAAAEALLEDAIENISEGFSLYDSEGHLELCNAHYMDYYDYSKKDIKGNPTIYDLLNLDFQRGTVTERVESTASYQQRTEGFGRKNDTPDVQLTDGRWLQIRDRKTSSGGIVSLHTDVTRRKEAELAQRTILDSISVPISIVKDRSGQILYCNEAASSLSGFTSDQLIGSKVIERYKNPKDRTRFIKCLRKEGRVNDFEVELKGPDDRPYWVLLSAVRFAFENQISFLSTWTDITERKKSEAALKESESRLRDLAQVTSDWYWETDVNDCFSFISEKFYEVMQVEPKDIIGKSRRQFSGKKERAANAEIWRLHFDDLDAHRPFRGLEYAINGTDGTERHIRVSGVPIIDEDGKFQGYRGADTDITERKLREAEIAEKETQLRAVLDSMPGGVRYVDKNKNYVFFNSQYSKLYGFPDDLLQVGLSNQVENLYQAKRGDFGPGDPDKLTKKWLRKIPVDDGPQHWESTTPDGRTLQVNTAPTVSGGVVNVVTDITERKKIQDELANQKEIMDTVLNNIGRGVSMYDKDRNFVFCNENLIQFLDLPRHLVATGQPVSGVFKHRAAQGRYGPGDPDNRAQKMIDNLNSTENFKHEITTVDDRQFEIHQIPLASGEMIAIHTDISEFRRAEKSIAESAQNIRDLIENVEQGVVIFAPDQTLQAWNQRFQDILKIPGQFLKKGAPAWDMTFSLANRGDFGDGDINELTTSRFAFFWDTPSSTKSEITRSGRIYEIVSQRTPEGGLVITYTDVTENKRAEAELKLAKEQAEELVRIKTDFVAVVSHEVRTPMNGVLGMARLLADPGSGRDVKGLCRNDC